MADSELKDWEVRQSKTFSKWVNMYLAKKGFDDRAEKEGQPFADSFKSSIIILKLMNSLYDVPVPKKYHKDPKTRVFALDNANKALKSIEAAEVKTTGLKQVNILDGDFKMMCGMVWNIILDYNIKGISVEDKNAKQGLLIWCRKKTTGYQGVNGKINNFTGDWKNGNAFLALVDKHTTGLVDYNGSYDKSAEEKLDEAFTACEGLGIPRLLEISDLTEVEHIDDKSVMTYVSELFKLFSKEDAKDVARTHVAQFLKFQRQIAVKTGAYEEKAATLLGWVEETVEGWQNSPDPVDGAECSQYTEAFKEYMLNEKPSKVVMYLDALDLYSQIQADLKLNGRVAYEPPEGLAPGNLTEGITTLASSENAHVESIRTVRAGLIEKMEVGGVTEEVREQWAKAFEAFDKDNNAGLNKDEYKAAMTACSVVLSDEDVDANFASQQVDDHVSKENFLQFLEHYFSTDDSPESLTKSAQQLGDPESADFDLASLGLDEEEIAYLQEQMGEDGTLASFIQGSFSS